MTTRADLFELKCSPDGLVVRQADERNLGHSDVRHVLRVGVVEYVHVQSLKSDHKTTLST